jgi:hypothetical protein
MDNASLILLTLDGHLKNPVRLILYGRAALQLGFNDPPPEVAQSKDVDAIIPLADLEGLSADEGFWDAQEATNSELRGKGLYVTHLFCADQVFLRRDWERHLLPIARPPTRWLPNIFRKRSRFAGSTSANTIVSQLFSMLTSTARVRPLPTGTSRSRQQDPTSIPQDLQAEFWK